MAGGNRLNFFFGFLILIMTVVFFNGNQHLKENKKIMNLNYIVTETSIPDSFDPLLADKSNNILMMRMLYHTPIQVNSSNELVSNVLERFEYSPNDFKIKFLIKKNLGQFSDGSQIDKKDILIAILRMSYFRPEFPVIKDIVGVQDWASKKNGLVELPKGITINENVIEVQLVRHNQNALFRFCLELFSIIPSRCIDLKSGQLICDQPSFSGYYDLESKTNKEYRFKKRNSIDKSVENILYNEIIFQYKTFEESCNIPLNENTIISGTDIGFNSSKCTSKFKPEQVHWLQASRFGAVLFNPNVKPFNSARVRRYYANKIREYFSNKTDMIVSKSLFSQLLPGHLKDSRFPHEILPLKVNQDISISIANYANPISEMVSEAIDNASQEQGIARIKTHDDLSKNTENFLNNKLGYILSASGFWPQDPIGDISMYFTKKLHTSLKFVWQDNKMYELIKSIEDEADSLKIKSKMEDLNQHLYEESLIANVIHFRRLYIAHESVKTLNIPLSVTSPAPWHLIPNE